MQPKGQAYGAAKRQQNFVQQTGSAQIQPQVAPTVQPGADAEAAPETDLGDLTEALLAPTRVPGEPVTAGLDRFVEQDMEELRDWFPVLQELAADPSAPNVLKEAAARAAVLIQRGG